MKTLTLTSEFFQNECAESFCKAILGNVPKETENSDYLFIGFDSRYKYPFYCSDLIQYEQLTFNLDDQFSVDWACLAQVCFWAFQLGHHIETYECKDFIGLELDLEWLATLQGVIIEEAGE